MLQVDSIFVLQYNDFSQYLKYIILLRSADKCSAEVGYAILICKKTLLLMNCNVRNLI